jgi:hypothetical protein
MTAGRPSALAHRWRKPVHSITDRAKRYRAQAPECRPPGPRVCALCGSRRNVEVGHVSGDESDGARENLMWNCRSCNTRMGALFKRLGIGRRTRQFNPAAGRGSQQGARNLAQWVVAVMSMKGESGEMSVPAAVAMVRATPPERRSEFAQEIWDRRREHGTDTTVPF